MRVLFLIIVGLATTWSELVNLNSDPVFSNFFNNYFQLWDQNKKSPSVEDSTQREISIGGATSKRYETKIGIDGTKTTIETTASADGSQITVETVISPDGSKTVKTLKSQKKISQLEPKRQATSKSTQSKAGTEGGIGKQNTILSDGSKVISQTILNLNETSSVGQIKSIQGSKNNSQNLMERNKTIPKNNPLGSTTTQTKIGPDGKKTVTKTTISPEGRKTVSIQTAWDSNQQITQQNDRTILSMPIKNSNVSENKPIINETDYNRNRSDDFLNLLNGKINNKANQPIQQKWKSELSQHNFYRMKHGVSALLYSAQLSQIAQSFAQKLSSIRGLVLYHSGNTFQGKSAGQNLYRASYDPSGGQATDSWYHQISQYGWDGQFSSATGHFTQLIWKDSKYVGFGFSGGVVVANYYPAGNFIGRFQQNVLRPIK